MELTGGVRGQSAMDSAARALYAGTVTPKIGGLLEEAMTSYSDTARAEALLKQAQREAPEALPVYFSLYKFYFYKGRLAEAESAVRLALSTSAQQAGFSGDFRELSATTANWSSHEGPQHFYLFSLKALAFIRLRRGDKASCDRILEKLAELDRTDSVGASVIGSIAAAV